jgi:hypothetical protein
MKDKTLQFIGYSIKGVSDVTLWGGGNACIVMDEFNVKHLREIKKDINDGEFGVESINGAICDIYARYRGEHKEYRRSISVGNVSDNTWDYYYQL